MRRATNANLVGQRRWPGPRMPAFCGRSETAPSAPNAPIFLKSPFGADTQRRYDQCHNAHPFSGRAHKRAARSAITPRQAAKVQPALRAYATKDRPSTQLHSLPDIQTNEAGTSRNYTAPRSDQRRQWSYACSCHAPGAVGCNRGCGRPVFAPPPIPEMTRPTSPPAQLRARVDSKRRHPGRTPGSSPNRSGNRQNSALSARAPIEKRHRKPF